MHRRDLLRASVAAAALGVLRVDPARAADLHLGPPEPFDWDGLIERTRQLAAEPYTEPYRPVPEITEQIDYEEHGKLNFDRDYALFADGPGVYPLTFFALGQRFPKKVTMHVLEDGQAREILYSPEYFEMPASRASCPRTLGSPASACTRRRRARTGARRTGWRSWARPISARSVR
jgi:glucans biosynthesis protein